MHWDKGELSVELWRTISCVNYISSWNDFKMISVCVFTENIWFVCNMRTRCWSWPRRGPTMRRLPCCSVYWRMPIGEKVNWRPRTGRQRAQKCAAQQHCRDNVLCVTLNSSKWPLRQKPASFTSSPFGLFLPRLINQRLMEEQSQVEELQKTLQEQGSKADDVSHEIFFLQI